MAGRENFFLLLGLDPAVDDWVAIELRITEQQRHWSRDRSQGNPKARRQAERNLALVPEIRAVLKDPEQRRQEAREARKRQQEVVRERERELDEAIELLRSSGRTCDEAQLSKLLQRFGKDFSTEEIKKRVRAAGVEIVGARTEQKNQAKEQIDKVTASNIRRNLDHLGLTNLYEFLELRPQSSPQALSDRANEIYKEIQRLGKIDADASARSELAGLAMKLFRDAAEKQKYDNTLALEAMEGLKENIELAGADRLITRQEMDALVQQARQRSVSAEDARAYIETYAANRKWVVQQDTDLPAEALKLCGFCGALASATAKQCSRCGEALEQPCPRCGTLTPTDQPACSQCGCVVGDGPLVQSLLKEAERLVLEGALAEAMRCLDKALHYWPEWLPAIEARQRVEARGREREEELAAIERLVRQRHLVTARTALERFQRSHGSGETEGIRERVEEGLVRAEAAFREGQRRHQQGDSEAASDRYDEALAASADFEPALAALRANPPPAPSGLEVRAFAAGFRLSWQPAATRRTVAYRVVRKAGAAPHCADDGTVVVEKPDTRVDDTEVPVGEASYYAVYTVRSGVPSPRAAESGPHLRTAEISNLEALSGNREVTLHWTRPPGSRRAQVWRQTDRLPETRGDGAEVPVAGDGVHDTGLENGRCYGYRIVAYFPDPVLVGGEIATAGETVTVTPVAPPAVIEDLVARRQGRVVMLTWTPVPGASVQVRRSSRRPDCVSGQILAISQLDSFGPGIANSTPTSAQAVFEGQGRLFFVPFSIAGTTAVAGSAVEVNHLDAVADLGARRAGSGILLTWKWPEGLDEVVVCHAPDRYPENPKSYGGSRIRVTRREYESGGGWLLRHPERVPHYFSVFGKAGDDAFSSPAKVLVGMGQTAAVSYRVVVKRAFLRRTIEGAWLELTCNDANAHFALPELVVVGRARQVPLSARDGEIFLEVPSLRFENGRASIPIPQRHWNGQPYVKLFFKNPAEAREVRLLPADQERLCIM